MNFSLRTIFKMGATDVQLFTNSRLVANQFGKFFKAREERMEAYLDILGNYTQ